MEIQYEFPPNYAQIKAALPITEASIYCYGKTLYVPYKQEVPEDIMEHEKIHVEQQGSTPEAWWEKYLSVPEFRLEMELEAYRAQYKFIKANYPSKAHKEALDELANNLSTVYNINMDYFGAYSLIRHG